MVLSKCTYVVERVFLRRSAQARVLGEGQGVRLYSGDIKGWRGASETHFTF